MSDLIHRDDIPMDVVAEIEKQFAESHPGMKVVFAGDHAGELPPEMAAVMAEIEDRQMAMLAGGLCMDCGAAMPNWADFEKEDWRPSPGWKHFTSGEGESSELVGFQCPACDAKESE